jgi:hypothetical protein
VEGKVAARTQVQARPEDSILTGLERLLGFLGGFFTDADSESAGKNDAFHVVTLIGQLQQKRAV